MKMLLALSGTEFNRDILKTGLEIYFYKPIEIKNLEDAIKKLEFM